MSRSRLAALLSILLAGCNLSLAGKDRCRNVDDCLSGHQCLQGVCVPDGTCLRQCMGRQCGDDSCGGSCGECGAGFHCDEGTGFCTLCQALDYCKGKQCGDDGCGRTCGRCYDWQVCNSLFQCETPAPDAGVTFEDGGWGFDGGWETDAGGGTDAGGLVDAGS